MFERVPLVLSFRLSFNSVLRLHPNPLVTPATHLANNYLSISVSSLTLHSVLCVQ